MENQIKISELRSKAWDLMQEEKYQEASELYIQCLLWYPQTTSHPNYSTNDKQNLTKLFLFCREMMKQEEEGSLEEIDGHNTENKECVEYVKSLKEAVA